jgi:hypothetical protein
MTLKRDHLTRRQMMNSVLAVATVATIAELSAQRTGAIAGFDHVALPLQNTDAIRSRMTTPIP